LLNLKLCEAGKEIKDATGIIGWRKSEAVEITNEQALRAPYVRYENVLKVDKTAIKAALKDGVKMNGAELVKRNNIQVK